MGVETTILDYLDKHKEGASTSVISQETGHTRATVAKYLEMMKLRGKVDYREVGKAKLWVLSEKKKKILVAEDDAHIRRLIMVILGKEDYELIEAADGQEALEKVSSEMPALIVLDVMMPKVDGIEVCQQIKKNALTRSIPVIMLTAKREMTDKIIGVKAGADDYLTKPFEPGELRVRVKTFLEKKMQERNPVTNLPNFESSISKLKSLDLDMNLLSLKNLDLYRKAYGFSKTNELLRLTSQIITHCVEKMSQKSFIAHLEPSSFIVAAEKSRSAGILKEIENEFNSTIPFFYNIDYDNIDFKKNMITMTSEKGKMEDIPIVRLTKTRLKKENLSREKLLELAGGAK